MPSKFRDKLLIAAREWEAARPPDTRRRCPVRLSDVPVEVRLYAARSIDGDADERRDILMAALFPSDTIYWIAA